MTPCQTSLPRQWLMTDERMGQRLWQAIGRLPAGAGIVVRHHATEPARREEIAARIAEMARGRGFVLAIARDAALARRLGAQFVHNPEGGAGDLSFSRSVHSLEQAQAARAEGAAFVFVSPIHQTRSHPGHAPLGVEQAKALARAAGVPAIALGGMDARKFAALEDAFHGWAAIDAWLVG